MSNADQLSIVEAGPVANWTSDQFFSTPKLAGELVALADVELARGVDANGSPLRILEPSAGSGNIVRAIQARAPGAIVDAVEIDERWAHHLRVLCRNARVFHADYLARAAPPQRYHLAACNVPYSKGAEVDHLAKLLNECERILAILPARACHGKTAFEKVWSQFATGVRDAGWFMRTKIHKIIRPPFGEKGGSDEIVLLDLERGDYRPCDVRWTW